MLLYLEKDLDRAYRLDCKARAKVNEPWVTREQFRSLYEDLISLHLSDTGKILTLVIHHKNSIEGT